MGQSAEAFPEIVSRASQTPSGLSVPTREASTHVERDSAEEHGVGHEGLSVQQPLRLAQAEAHLRPEHGLVVMSGGRGHLL